MAWQPARRASALLALALLAGAASAQEVCVSCSEPDLTYRCTIKDSERAANIRGAGRVLEYLCLTELARAGGHQNCRVSREYSGPCIGQPRQLDLAKLPEIPPQNSGSQDATAGQSPDGTAEPARTAAPRPPRTLEEMAREAGEKSKQQFEAADRSMKQAAKDAGTKIGEAGTAVGDALKKSVVCVVTLFLGCFEKSPPK